METFENIKYLREKRGLSQEELASMVGYKDRSSIAKVESGLVDLSQSKIAAFADALGVTPAQLMCIAPETPQGIEPLPAMRKVPLLGTIACGTPILAAENLDGYVKMPENVHADFCLRCKGDSMINARIYDGDIVFIRQQPSVENGEIAAVLIDDTADIAETTLKRVYIYDSKVMLVAENPKYPPMSFEKEEMNSVRILGKAVAFLSGVR